MKRKSRNKKKRAGTYPELFRRNQHRRPYDERCENRKPKGAQKSAGDKRDFRRCARVINDNDKGRRYFASAYGQLYVICTKIDRALQCQVGSLACIRLYVLHIPNTFAYRFFPVRYEPSEFSESRKVRGALILQLPVYCSIGVSAVCGQQRAFLPLAIISIDFYTWMQEYFKNICIYMYTKRGMTCLLPIRFNILNITNLNKGRGNQRNTMKSNFLSRVTSYDV